MCDDDRRSPAGEQHDKQPVEDTENGGAIVIPDADDDAEDIRMKTVRDSFKALERNGNFMGAGCR